MQPGRSLWVCKLLGTIRKVASRPHRPYYPALGAGSSVLPLVEEKYGVNISRLERAASPSGLARFVRSVAWLCVQPMFVLLGIAVCHVGLQGFGKLLHGFTRCPKVT